MNPTTYTNYLKLNQDIYTHHLIIPIEGTCPLKISKSITFGNGFSTVFFDDI